MDINKENIDYYIEGGKREALRARLLKTMNPETKLPEALRDTYESTEDYIIRSAIDIYKPLMLLVDKVGATDVQKQILKNVVEAILADKKMIVPYSNTEDEKCISYKNIEDQVGIKLNPEAISLLVSFTRTYLYNEVSKEGEGHSIIIATHRIPEHTYFYLGEGGERVEVLSREKADELAEQGYDLGITYCGNEKDYNFIKRPKPEPVYERYVDGQLVSAREITSEAVLKFKELYEEYYLESPIEDGINDIETFKKITSEKYKDDKDGIRSKVFRILLNMEIIKKVLK